MDHRPAVWKYVVLEEDALGNQTAWNVYGINLIQRQVGTDTLNYMYNGHADVTALLDESGTVVATYYYDAFGNILEITGSADNNILYAGYQYDPETGLYYLHARMYDPTTARFLQKDTYRGQYNDPLSLNLYTYCHNEPLMYDDPTGHRPDVSADFSRETADERKLSLKAAKEAAALTIANEKAKAAAIAAADSAMKIGGTLAGGKKTPSPFPIDPDRGKDEPVLISVTVVIEPPDPTPSPAPSPTPIPTATPSASTTGMSFSDAFWEQKKGIWLFPLETEPLHDPLTGGRQFGAKREKTDKDGHYIRDRLHAGVDLKQVAGTDVFAMASGIVIEVSSNFYMHTGAVAVKCEDGVIIRYTEISVFVELNDKVEQGQVIGEIMKSDSGSQMLHLEIYTGTATGPLTQEWNRLENTHYDYVDIANNEITYERRSDLVNPSGVLILPRK